MTDQPAAPQPAAPQPAAPQPVLRTTLLDQALPGAAPIAHVEIRRITIAPSLALGAHVHNGPVFGSIETGSAIFQVEDGPTVTLHPGDTFYEPATTTITKFDAGASGVTFLGYFLLGPGQSPQLDFVATPTA